MKREVTYLLRLWREQPPGSQERACWRVSLKDVRSQEVRYFASLASLAQHLSEPEARLEGRDEHW